MEAVTDVVFRHVIAHAAKPDIFFTEFTNVSSFCSEKGVDSTRGRLEFTEDEQPIVAQIWGTKPEEFAQMSVGMAKLGFSGIDINMGCPVKAVVKSGAGCAMIRTPELVGHIISAAKAGGLPVSVKTRLGDISTDEWPEWLGSLLSHDIANLTIHLRTRKEMSKVPAHYELIPDIKALRDKLAPNTLLTINGDIRDREHGEELAEQYGIDGVMIARGIFHNPFAFALTGSGSIVTDSNNQRGALIALLNLHLDLHDKYDKEFGPRKFDPLKRFFKIYVRDFPGASEIRDKLMHTKNTAEVRDILESLQPIEL